MTTCLNCGRTNGPDIEVRVTYDDSGEELNLGMFCTVCVPRGED